MMTPVGAASEPQDRIAILSTSIIIIIIAASEIVRGLKISASWGG
jgi:hypothetical protein